MAPLEGPPTVSVVIPARNAAATIGMQLEALSRQTGDVAFEVLVCDNGSTDATRDAILACVATVPGLRIVDASARAGAGAARNIGATLARGALLLFCDADDVVADGWVAAMARALAHADLVGGSKEGRLLNDGNRASVSWQPSADIRMPYWPRYGAASSSNLGIRSSVFAAVGGFDEALRASEDVDLCWRVQLAGGSFARAADAVVHSRQRDGRRAVFRQAFGYAAGERAMRKKYRALIAADREDGVPPVAELRIGDAPAVSASTPVLSSAGRLRRALTPAGQANLAWRLGELLGRRFARVDPRVRPVPRSGGLSRADSPRAR